MRKYKSVKFDVITERTLVEVNGGKNTRCFAAIKDVIVSESFGSAFSIYPHGDRQWLIKHIFVHPPHRLVVFC